MSHNKSEFLKNRKREYYYKEAKKIDVRARSYFKLEQIDKKFNIVRNNLTIIDLGCAPGGWLQYLDRNIKHGNILGIDLLEIKKKNEFSQNVKIIEDDFNNIGDYLTNTTKSFDLILSDMAPEFSGNSFLDRGRTHKLNIKTIDFAKQYLVKGGNLIFKSFEGEDLGYVRKLAKKVFKEIKEFKPKSSQNKSAEVFEICLNKL